MQLKLLRPVRVLIALAIAVVIVIRTMFFSYLGERMDSVFLLLLASAALLVLLPLERVTNLSVGSVGVTLDSPQVRGAFASSLDRVANQTLRRRLDEMLDDVSVLPGARLLWIDDYPNEVLGERRILRSLGVEVVTVASTSEAVLTLSRDGDFDLIVTDVQREGGLSYESVGGNPLHEGTNFVVALRRGEVPDLAAAPYVREINVLFYAAYDRAALLEFTRSARELDPCDQRRRDPSREGCSPAGSVSS